MFHCRCSMKTSTARAAPWARVAASMRTGRSRSQFIKLMEGFSGTGLNRGTGAASLSCEQVGLATLLGRTFIGSKRQFESAGAAVTNRRVSREDSRHQLRPAADLQLSIQPLEMGVHGVR